MTSLELQRFSMRSIVFDPKENKGPVIVIIGKRDTGKSYLIRDLLFYHKDIPIGTVISGTEASNGFYRKMIPRLFIHEEYSSELVNNLINRQKMAMKRLEKDKQLYNKQSSIDPRCFLIVDDCLYDNSWAKDKLMRMLFFNGRHWKVMLIITMQYPLGIPPILRTNIDYVFIFRENISQNRKRIWESYASMFPTFELFCSVMDQTTENYECLVINNNVKSNKLSDQVMWYKAEDHAEFKLGSKEFWTYSDQLADDSDDDAPVDFGRKKGSAGAVTVRKKMV